ncbi:MAG TPA: hypothetical protein VI454_04445, partial [Verrucomicrobiae bacterium]
HPHVVFTEKMLRPELQDWDVFADGMENIVATQRRVAQHYFADGSVELACPPLRALLHVMRDDHFEGRNLDEPGVRALFSREQMLASDWYQERLVARQANDVALYERHVRYLEQFLGRTGYADEAGRLDVAGRLTGARAALQLLRSPGYLKHLRGTLGAEPALARMK